MMADVIELNQIVLQFWFELICFFCLRFEFHPPSFVFLHHLFFRP